MGWNLTCACVGPAGSRRWPGWLGQLLSDIVLVLESLSHRGPTVPNMDVSVIPAGIRQLADAFALVAVLFGLFVVLVAWLGWRALSRPVSLFDLIVGGLVWRHWRRRRAGAPMGWAPPCSEPYPPPWYESPTSSSPPALPSARYGPPSASSRLGAPPLPEAPVADEPTPPTATDRHVGRSVVLGPRHRGRY
jgi:hypothetical protein